MVQIRGDMLEYTKKRQKGRVTNESVRELIDNKERINNKYKQNN